MMRAWTRFSLPSVFALGLAAGPGCGDDTVGLPTSADMTVGPHGDYHTYAANGIKLPQSGSDYAIDLNGDNRPDNQLGKIVDLLNKQMLDLQFPVDVTVMQGDAVELFSLQTGDNTLKNDPLVGLDYYIGRTFGGMITRLDSGVALLDGGCTMCPDFSGNGMFQVDPAIAPSVLTASLTNAHVQTDSPVTTKHPVTIHIKLALGPGQAPMDLIVNGAHFEFDTGLDMATGKPGLINGRVMGSVKNTDVQKNVVPAIAVLLSTDIKNFPTASSSMQIEGLFDKGGCANPDGSMAKAGDAVIDTCEVANNGLIQVVLAPDVAIFDKNGNYAPDKNNANPDSLSIGLGFTAVGAAFARP